MFAFRPAPNRIHDVRKNLDFSLKSPTMFDFLFGCLHRPGPWDARNTTAESSAYIRPEETAGELSSFAMVADIELG